MLERQLSREGSVGKTIAYSKQFYKTGAITARKSAGFGHSPIATEAALAMLTTYMHLTAIPRTTVEDARVRSVYGPYLAEFSGDKKTLILQVKDADGKRMAKSQRVWQK